MSAPFSEKIIEHDRSLRNASIGIGIVTSILVCVFIVIMIIFLFVSIGKTEQFIFDAAANNVEGYKVAKKLSGNPKKIEKFIRDRYPKIVEGMKMKDKKKRESFILNESMNMKSQGFNYDPYK